MASGEGRALMLLLMLLLLLCLECVRGRCSRWRLSHVFASLVRVCGSRAGGPAAAAAVAFPLCLGFFSIGRGKFHSGDLAMASNCLIRSGDFLDSVRCGAWSLACGAACRIAMVGEGRWLEGLEDSMARKGWGRVERFGHSRRRGNMQDHGRGQRFMRV